MVTLITTALGNRVRSLRDLRGWSQKELAAHAKVPRPWLSLVESGEIRDPSAKRMDRVAIALGVDVHHLLTGDQAGRELTLRLPEADADDATDIRILAAFPRRVRRYLIRQADSVLEYTEDNEDQQDADEASADDAAEGEAS